MKACNVKTAGSFLQFIEFIENCIEEMLKGSSRIKKVVFHNSAVIIKKYSKDRWFVTKSIDLDRDDQLIDLANEIGDLVEPKNLDIKADKLNVEKNHIKFFITKATS